MDPTPLNYQRARFHTRLPRTILYTPDHYWLRHLNTSANRWQIGLTSYAIRLLGDLVEHEWAIPPGSPITLGEKLGWLDGFKAVTDLVSLLTGTFERGNPELLRNIDLLTTDPFGTGWLYEAVGTSGQPTLDVDDYAHHLNDLIDTAWARQQAQQACP